VSYCRCRDGAVENRSGWLGIGLSPSAKGPPMATLVRIERIHKTTGPPPMSDPLHRRASRAYGRRRCASASSSPRLNWRWSGRHGTGSAVKAAVAVAWVALGCSAAWVHALMGGTPLLHALRPRQWRMGRCRRWRSAGAGAVGVQRRLSRSRSTNPPRRAVAVHFANHPASALCP
jgi:hypothetical protein